MEKTTKTKTHMEIFTEKYPAEEVKRNPLKATEAYGYLECLEQFLPSDSWIDMCKSLILVTLFSIADERLSDNE